MWSFGPTVPKAKMLISQSREGGIVAPTHITGYMKLEELQRVFKPETVKKDAELQPA